MILRQQAIKIIIITLKKNPQKSSGRTRNRINEAGPDFILVKAEGPSRQNEMLLRSLKTGWFGWLPKDEVIVVSKITKEDDLS